MKRLVILATIVFVGLAIVFAVLAVIAKLVFAGDGFSQGLLLAIGASAFGSGQTAKRRWAMVRAGPGVASIMSTIVIVGLSAWTAE